MMRNLALALVNWLIRAFALSVVDDTRRMGGKDAIERGARWEAFYSEEGGLADMIAGLRREAFEAAAELDPRETDLIVYWATADRNLRKLQQRIEAVVQTGKIEADRIKRVDQMKSASIRR